MLHYEAEDKELIAVVNMRLAGACAWTPNMRRIIDFHLTPYGVDIDEFCTQFDERTAAAEVFNWPVGVMVFVYEGGDFLFEFTRSNLLGSPVSFKDQLPDICGGSRPPRP
ncbi:MAG: hypothetical protein KDJ15_04545 [Alphaproteobacteria bacterium]|nr:hypothetical protein [Alphaproteobacteria bacterium]